MRLQTRPPLLTYLLTYPSPVLTLCVHILMCCCTYLRFFLRLARILKRFVT